ncbi:MAG: hypothetical protein M1822_000806 [Bathelium mastoideum]|nr:MAG: hypothetical protein M1822_000806 [Bathelium mastoideum]
MAQLGLSLLVVTLSFLAYRHGHALWAIFPRTSGGTKPRSREPEESVNSNENEDGELNNTSSHSTEATPLPSTKAPRAEPNSPNSTPKASSTQVENDVPSFALNDTSEIYGKNVPGPRSPTASEQTPSALPPLPSQANPSSSELMPPPRIPLPRKTMSNAAQVARIPTTGPLPNRGPATPRPASSLAVPGVAALPTTNSRNKVVLAPGRSSIDWAQLTKKSDNLSGVPYLQRVTPSQLKQMNGRKGRLLWASYQGRVYNLTPYAPYHPGGEGELMRAAGKDAEELFNDVHAYVNWENMLSKCCVGIMVTENDGTSRGTDDWEAMD